MAVANECTRLKLFAVPSLVDILEEYKAYLSEK
jgi:hypothetical protein